MTDPSPPMLADPLPMTRRGAEDTSCDSGYARATGVGSAADRARL